MKYVFLDREGSRFSGHSFLRAAFFVAALFLALTNVASAAVYTSPPANVGTYGVYPNCIAPAIPVETHSWWDEDANPSATDDAPRHLHIAACMPTARGINDPLIPKLTGPEPIVVRIMVFNNPSQLSWSRWQWQGDTQQQVALNLRCTPSVGSYTLMAGRPQCTWYVDETISPSGAHSGIDELRMSPNISSHDGLGTRQYTTLNFQVPVEGLSGHYRGDTDIISRSWYNGAEYANVEVGYVDHFHGTADLNKSVPVVSGVVPIRVRTQNLGGNAKVAVWQDMSHHMDPTFWKTAQEGAVNSTGGKLIFQRNGEFDGTVNWDTRGLSDGRHTMYFQAQETTSAGLNAAASALFFDVCNSGGNCSVSTAPTITFSANPTSITSGQSSTLTWSSTNATSCSASGGWSGSKNTSGTQSVTPSTTTAYTLTCTGAGGSTSGTFEVTVSGGILQVELPVFSPPGGSFTTSPTITITSATVGANIYYTTNGSTPTTASTHYTIPFLLTSSATVKAVAVKSGMTDSVVESDTYTITTTPAPTVALSANPTPITSGQSSTLTWSSTNATSCAASGGWSGSKSTFGTLAVSPTATTIYTLACTGAGGTGTGNATVTVTSAVQPAVLSITSPREGETMSGSVVNVSYAKGGDLTGVDHVHFSLDGAAEVRDLDFDGSYQFTAVVAGTHTLTGFLARADHSKVAGTDVTRHFTTTNPVDTPLPVISFSVSPTSIGQSWTLTWSSINTTSCVALNGWSGGKPTIGTQTLTPTQTTTYTLACTGTGGTDTKSVTVTVNTSGGGVQTTFSIGAYVKTTSSLHVRESASLFGNDLGKQRLDRGGTLVAGPVSANGYIWWQIDYHQGVDGWSAEQWLALLTITPRLRMGDRIITTDSVHARSAPNVSANKLARHAVDELGTIVGGPAYADGYWWWNMNYDINPDGWSIENFMQSISGVTPPPTSFPPQAPPNPTPLPTPTPTPIPAPVVTLLSSPTSVIPGGPSTLTWSSTNATLCSASGGWSGSKGTSGIQSVTPTATTVYTLACTGAGGTTTNTATVTVSTATPIPTVTLSVSPTTITSGQSSTLTWSSTNATSCTASGGTWIGTKNTSGSQSVSPTATIIYTLACTGAGGTTTKTATVTVNTGPLPPVVTLSTSPTIITSGQSSTLTWSSTNATSCTAFGGWTGTQAVSGTLVVYPTRLTTYQLSCDGAGGTDTKSVTVALSAGGGGGGVSTEANFTVAYFADTDTGTPFQNVLNLVKNERVNGEPVDMAVVPGDLSYGDSAKDATWMNMVNTTLGSNFPVFLTKGNHEDAARWTANYGPFVAANITSTGISSTCIGQLGSEAGRNTACTYKGLRFVLSDAGESSKEDTPGTNTNFINSALTGSSALWKLCAWHRNQKNFNAETKGDEVGWAPYEACRQQGAMVVNGHEHSYSRTKSLVNMVTQAIDTTVASDANTKIAPGSTFVVVAGMGGKCCRGSGAQASLPHWAVLRTTATNPQGADGALFITYNFGGDPKKASAYYKSVNGTILDQFTITVP